MKNNHKKTDVWIFYLKNVDEEKKDIYAYTTEESIATAFAKQRNMQMFKCKRAKFDKKELNQFYQFATKRGSLLSEICLPTLTEKGVCDIKLMLTQLERMTIDRVSSSLQLYYFFTSTWATPLLFNKKMYKALETLGYVGGYRFLKTGVKEDEFFIDELGIFIKHFGYTM